MQVVAAVIIGVLGLGTAVFFVLYSPVTLVLRRVPNKNSIWKNAELIIKGPNLLLAEVSWNFEKALIMVAGSTHQEEFANVYLATRWLEKQLGHPAAWIDNLVGDRGGTVVHLFMKRAEYEDLTHRLRATRPLPFDRSEIPCSKN